jgi:hypothetical protein
MGSLAVSRKVCTMTEIAASERRNYRHQRRGQWFIHSNCRISGNSRMDVQREKKGSSSSLLFHAREVMKNHCKGTKEGQQVNHSLKVSKLK